MPAKARRAPPPKNHHLDRRAGELLAVDPGNDDDMLTAAEVAIWLAVSVPWLTIGRSKGYGPKYIKYEDNKVAYRRGDVRAYLKSRTFSSVAEYRNA